LAISNKFFAIIGRFKIMKRFLFLFIIIIAPSYALGDICVVSNISTYPTFQVYRHNDYGFSAYILNQEVQYMNKVEETLLRMGIFIAPWTNPTESTIEIYKGDEQMAGANASISFNEEKLSHSEVNANTVERIERYRKYTGTLTDYAIITSQFDNNRIKLLDLNDDLNIIYSKNKVNQMDQIKDSIADALESLGMDANAEVTEIDKASSFLERLNKAYNSNSGCDTLIAGEPVSNPSFTVVSDLQTVNTWSGLLNEFKARNMVEEVLISMRIKVHVWSPRITREVEEIRQEATGASSKGAQTQQAATQDINATSRIVERYIEYDKFKSNYVIVTSLSDRRIKIYRLQQTPAQLIGSMQLSSFNKQPIETLLKDALKAMNVKIHL
jgi:hypothetical protein